MRFGSVYTEPFSPENPSRDGISERLKNASQKRLTVSGVPSPPSQEEKQRVIRICGYVVGYSYSLTANGKLRFAKNSRIFR